MRQCGECQLCCKLLPMHHGTKVDGVDTPGSIHKAAGEPCPHQRRGKGCAIYPSRPTACRLWNCRWLVNNDTADLRRPDRSRYVIDVMPDFVTAVEEGKDPINIQVVQIWCDPKQPDAWRDPALLAYLERRGQEGIAAIVRFSEREGLTVIPPSMSADKQWHEVRALSAGREHTAAERAEALGWS